MRAFHFFCFSMAFAVITPIFAETGFLEKANKEATGKSIKQIQAERALDLAYIFIDPTCCCNEEILGLFALDTAEMTRASSNIATDNLISSLALIKDGNALTRKRLVYQKLINGMFSFADRGGKSIRVAKPDGYSPLPGCEPLDLDNKTDMAKYLSVIDSIEAGGDYTKEGERSSAYGRYQFMPSTAAQYCGRVTGEDCCGDAWKTSSHCQDEMFYAFTKDNANEAAKRGIPVNTCSVYLMHQQGVGGYLWMRGGNNPYGSIDKLKDVVKNNVSKEVWAEAQSAGLTGSEDGLRDTMNYYWSQKFGGDVVGDAGETKTLAEFTQSVDSFMQKVSDLKKRRAKLYRKGILRDIKEENFELGSAVNAYDTKNAERTLHIQQKMEDISR